MFPISLKFGLTFISDVPYVVCGKLQTQLLMVVFHEGQVNRVHL